MTWQGSGGNATGDGPGDGETRPDWRPGEPPAPPAPPNVPLAPWPATGAGPGPNPGGVWAPPPYGGGGRYAVPGAPGLEYAGALPRFAAFVLDVILIGFVAGIVALPFASTVTPSQANPFSWSTDYAVRTGVGSLIGVLAEAAYFTLLWMSSGRATLGMRLFSLQIGRADNGQRLDARTSFTRWLAFGSWLGVLGFSPALAGLGGLLQLGWSVVLLVSTMTSPTRQGIHDRIAGSAIVRPVGAGNGLAYACLAIALIIPLLAILSIIALVFLGGQVSDILSAVGESI